MKIAFLSHLDENLYLFRLPIMKELKDLGHTVYAIAPKGNFLEKFKEFGIETISYEIERSSLNPIKELIAIKNIYKVLKDLNLDILHTFTVKPNIYGLIAGKVAKVPKIINSITGLGSFYIDNSFKSKFVRFIINSLYKITLKFSSKVIFQNSDDLELFVTKNIITREKTALIKGSGIDTIIWNCNKNISDKIKVIMIGRVLKHKGVLEFIEMAKLLKPKYSTVSFIYVGWADNGNSSSLSDEFMRNIKEIEFLGKREDIKELICDSDIFVLPSYREGLPRTLIEATSLSKPIVTTNTVGCKECVDDGVNGFLVPLYDYKILANRVEELILDENLRKSFGENSRIKAIKEFDIKNIVEKHIKVYLE